MAARRGLLAAILVYLTLDLSLAAMPGAFQFEPTESVEAAHGGRTTPSADVVVLSATPESAIVAPVPREARLERRPVPDAPRLRVPARRCAAREPLDVARPSEDPH